MHFTNMYDMETARGVIVDQLRYKKAHHCAVMIVISTAHSPKPKISCH